MKRLLALLILAVAVFGAARSGSAEPVAPTRAVADALGRDIPLPAGGNFSGVRWEQAGELSRAQITAVLHYNAACQWLRAWRDGRAPVTALAGLASWPAWRGTETAKVLAEVEHQARTGGGPLLEGVLRDCDASHAREVEYARSLGLKPSG